MGTHTVYGGEELAEIVLLEFLLDLTGKFAKLYSQRYDVLTGVCNLAPVSVRVVTSDRIPRSFHESMSEPLTDLVPTIIAESGELLRRNVSIHDRCWITRQNRDRDRELALERVDIVCKLGEPQVYCPM